jgi:hypothetical protein
MSVKAVLRTLMKLTTGVKVLQEVSESGLGSILNSSRKAVEERLDPDTENPRIEECLTEAIGNLAKDIIVDGAAVGLVAAGAESIHIMKSRISGVKVARPHETWCQFHQHFFRSFNVCGSQKRKMILTTLLKFYAFGICALKS